MGQRTPVGRQAAQQAAQWLMRLSAEEATAQDQQEFARWLEADAEHEEAWQRAMNLQHRLGLIPKELSLATLGRKQRVSRRQVLNSIALLIVTAPASYLGYRHLPWQGFITEYSTRVGQQKAFTLEDGTQLHLNTDSWAEVKFDAQVRHIHLHHGELFLRTGKDSLQRPLVVTTSAGEIRPIGTAFTVRQLRDEALTAVRVLEGKVLLSTTGAEHPQPLVAGEKTRFSASEVESPERDSQPAADWVKGVLRTKNMLLGELVAELGRYRHGLLRCDPAVARLRVSGAFQLADTNQILRSLKHSLPVQVVFRTDYWVTILPAG